MTAFPYKRSLRALPLALAVILAATGPDAASEVNAPLGPLPPMPIPEDNPMTEANIALGKHLFFDARLSGDGSISCADCHDPKLGWGDGADLSRGYPGTMHWRNSQTVVNSGYLTEGWFWTSSAATLEAQAHSAIAGALAGNLKKVLAEERMKQILKEIQEGDFAKEFITEARSGNVAFDAKRRRAAEHPMEEVGARLRSLMPWLSENRLVDRSKN